MSRTEERTYTYRRKWNVTVRRRAYVRPDLRAPVGAAANLPGLTVSEHRGRFFHEQVSRDHLRTTDMPMNLRRLYEQPGYEGRRAVFCRSGGETLSRASAFEEKCC